MNLSLFLRISLLVLSCGPIYSSEMGVGEASSAVAGAEAPLPNTENAQTMQTQAPTSGQIAVENMVNQITAQINDLMTKKGTPGPIVQGKIDSIRAKLASISQETPTMQPSQSSAVIGQLRNIKTQVVGLMFNWNEGGNAQNNQNQQAPAVLPVMNPAQEPANTNLPVKPSQEPEPAITPANNNAEPAIAPVKPTQEPAPAITPAKQKAAPASAPNNKKKSAAKSTAKKR